MLAKYLNAYNARSMFNVNRYANTPVPEDYRVEFIDYDWTVNDQKRLE